MRPHVSRAPGVAWSHVGGRRCAAQGFILMRDSLPEPEVESLFPRAALGFPWGGALLASPAPTARRKHFAGKPCRLGPCLPGLLSCTPAPRSLPWPQPDGGREAAPAQWPRWVHMVQRGASREKGEARGLSKGVPPLQITTHCRRG